jgi:hypothetical protein
MAWQNPRRKIFVVVIAAVDGLVASRCGDRFGGAIAGDPLGTGVNQHLDEEDPHAQPLAV